MSEKLQKVLARAGLASRRQIESWIEEGRITVNRQVATLGARVDEKDRIHVDGRLIRLKSPERQMAQVIAYHKDIGTICTRTDPEGRPSVFREFPKLSGARWVLIGRLDLNTSGLLLATTDGELANRLMHPSNQIEREYAVRVYGEVDQAILHRLLDGVELDDGVARFEAIADVGGEGKNHWYRVILKEGRYREVRRLWESQGVQVNRLSRTRFGPISMPRRLKRGGFAFLTAGEVNQLYEAAGLASPHAAETKKAATKNKKNANRKRSARVR